MEQWMTKMTEMGPIAAGLWALMLVAVLVDLWDRCLTERRLKRPVTSRRLRKTVGKVLDYWRLLAIGGLVDAIGGLLPRYGLPYVSMGLCAGLVLVEAKSMWEHAIERRSGMRSLQSLSEAIVECRDKRSAAGLIGEIVKWMNAKEVKE